MILAFRKGTADEVEFLVFLVDREFIKLEVFALSRTDRTMLIESVNMFTKNILGSLTTIPVASWF